MRTKTLILALAWAGLATGCGGGGGDGGGSGTPGPVASITVQPGSLALSPGESRQLTASLRDSSGRIVQNRIVTWTSDDATRASVSTTGLVLARSAGNVRVTATAEGKSTAVQVTVSLAPAVVSRVSLNIVAEALEEGRRLALEATAYDSSDNVVTGRPVLWASGDPEIASVAADGIVTALRPGVISVSASVEGRSAFATIRVYANYDFDLLYSKADVEVPPSLHLLEINDPAAVELPVFQPGVSASHAAPSPDGTRVAYVVYGNWDGTYWQSMIFVADRSGGAATRVTYLAARNEEPAWSPDGSRLAFSSQPFGQPANIWVIDVDGANAVNVTADQTGSSKRSPAWSPLPIGGSYRIAYALEENGASFLWTMRADGGDKRRVTSDALFFDSEPAWSPDGGTLVFQRTGGAIYGDLYLVGSGGGSARALMPANPLAFGQFGPTWSPDGRLIAFTSKHADGEHYQVWTVWADGTRLARRTQDLVRHEDPAWILHPAAGLATRTLP